MKHYYHGNLQFDMNNFCSCKIRNLPIFDVRVSTEKWIRSKDVCEFLPVADMIFCDRDFIHSHMQDGFEIIRIDVIINRIIFNHSTIVFLLMQCWLIINSGCSTWNIDDRRSYRIMLIIKESYWLALMLDFIALQEITQSIAIIIISNNFLLILCCAVGW